MGDSPTERESADQQQRAPQTPEAELAQQVGRREERKLRGREQGHRTIWFGLGMFGLVGWSVALPTLGGALLGLWLDRAFPGTYSWTLMLLTAGLFLGCAIAWYWIEKERTGGP